MSKINSILADFRSRGYRLTASRKTILRIFLNSKAPLSAAELNERLEKLEVNVNKTTIYREIEFLKSQQVIRELPFGDGKKRYEKWPDKHHHHLVCISCDSIECIELKGCLEDEEIIIFKENNFKTIKHSLEFQGICGKCQ